jgi:hypothetical protein
MNGRRNYGLLAVAVAIPVVGLLWAGVPASRLFVLGLVLACPLMMFVMMRGMHGSGRHDQHDPSVQQRRDDNQHHHGR